MAGFHHRIVSAFIGCWAFVVSLTSTMDFIHRLDTWCVRVLNYVVKRTASRPAAVIAQWRIVQRMCSESIREKLNVFGQRPRSTGALCSPLI
ncbi:hypothetical protein ACS6JN_22750 [Enterobacter hormaechei subsp. steigerwaltii]|uniref:hypothetical protein n=1 Tax=Enterobacter hormaechei TaxID=158836 RepID=UPI003F42F1CA